MQGLLCDAELQVEGRVFRAHKAVLAAASPYFAAMYATARFKESGDSVTHLQVRCACVRVRVRVCVCVCVWLRCYRCGKESGDSITHLQVM